MVPGLLRRYQPVVYTKFFIYLICMRNKLSFVLIVSFLNTLLVTGAVSDFTFRSITWAGYSAAGNLGVNIWMFASGMFLLTFIVMAVLVLLPQKRPGDIL